MKVSLLVPVYGVEKYIAKCARSLFGQSYADIEFVFVDDATPDRSIEVLREVIAEYPDREKQVKIVAHPVNRGLSAARNTAIDNSTGEYVWHIDSDDFIEPDAVARLVAKAVAEDADMVVFDINEVRANGIRRHNHYIGSGAEEYVVRLLLRQTLAGVWCKFIRRDMFTRNGVRFIEGISYGEDYVTSPRVAYYARKVVKLDAALYNYVVYNTGSITRNINRKCLDDLVRAVDILAGFFAKTPYAEYIPMMKLRNRIDLIKVGGMELRRAAADLYPEIDYRKLPIPLLPDRLVLWMARRGMWRALDILIREGLRLKKLFKIK